MDVLQGRVYERAATHPWSAVQAAAVRVGAAQGPERSPSVTFSRGRRGTGDAEARPVSSASRGWAASVMRGV